MKKLHIDIDKNVCKSNNVYIFTTEGKLIKKQIVTGERISIDIAGLHGVYFVKICNGNSSQTLKISI